MFLSLPYSFILLLKLCSCSSVADASTERTRSTSSVVHEENHLISKDTQETCPPDTFQIRRAEVDPDWVVAGNMGSRPEFNISKSDPNLSSQSSPRVRDGRTADSIQLFEDGAYTGR